MVFVSHKDLHLVGAHASQAQRIVRRGDELHVRHSLAQRRDDVHLPAGMKVRLDFVGTRPHSKLLPALSKGKIE